MGTSILLVHLEAVTAKGLLHPVLLLAFTLRQVARKKNGRLFVTSGRVLVSTLAAKGAPMPLDVDNGLPGIEMRLGTTDDTEVTFICHVDTCAAMSTGNLQIHEWIMTTYPEIVAEYIRYDDNNPFEPIQFSCAV